MRLLAAMAWRNLGRNRRRSAISLAAVAFAVFCMIAMSAIQTGAYSDMIDTSVKIQTGHLQIQAPGYLDNNDVDLTLDHPDRVYQALDGLPEVVGAAGRIVTSMLVAQGEQSFGALVIGTDAAREAKTSVLPHVVRHGRYLDAADPNGVLVSDKLAKNLFTTGEEAPDLESCIGRELILLGQAVDGSTAAARVTIRGIIRTGQPEMDRATVMMNLATIQDLLLMNGRVNTIAVLLHNHEQIETVKARLTSALSDLDPPVVVLTWEQVAPAIAQGIAVDNASGKAMVFLLLLVVAFGILNTFLMSAFERFREFGVLMALGVKPRTCGGMLLMESQMLMALGFVVGAVLGGGLSLWLHAHGLNLPGAEGIYESYGMNPTIRPVLTTGIVLRSMLETWAVTLVVSLYPAWKITGFRPVEAMRRV